MARGLKIALWLGGAIGGALLLFIAGILVLFRPSEDEVARKVSPDGRIDAVLVERNSGATDSFGYAVYITEHDGAHRGRPAAYLYGAVRNDSAGGADLRWETSSRLAIEYWKAQGTEIITPVTPVAGRNVEVVIRDGIRDESAPAGGMHYSNGR